MLSVLLIAAAAIWIPGTILLFVHARLAPVGVQDEFGFRVLLDPKTALRYQPHVHPIHLG